MFPIEDLSHKGLLVLGTLAYKAISFKENKRSKESRMVMNTSYLVLLILHLRVCLGFEEAASFMLNGITTKYQLAYCPRRMRE